MATAKELLLQEGHSKEVYSVEFQEDGALVASGFVKFTNDRNCPMLTCITEASMLLVEFGIYAQDGPRWFLTATSKLFMVLTSRQTGGCSFVPRHSPIEHSSQIPNCDRFRR